MRTEAWKTAEDEFDRHWVRLGKGAYLYKFKDARALHGMNKRQVAAGVQPSDRLVTHEGVTFYAEVKYTEDLRGFNFTGIKPSQIAAATQVLAAGGEYRIYIKSGASGLWYCVPYGVIQSWPTRSMTWKELEPYECTM